MRHTTGTPLLLLLVLRLLATGSGDVPFVEAAEQVACVTGGGTCTSIDDAGDRDDDNNKKAINAKFDAFESWVDDRKEEVDRFFGKIFDNSAATDSAAAAAATGSSDPKEKKKNVLDVMGETFKGATDFVNSVEMQGGDVDESGSGGFTGNKEMFAALFKMISSIDAKDSEESAMNLIERAREVAEGQGAYETRTFKQTYNLFSVAFSMVKDSMQKAFGDLDLTKFSIFAYLYFLEYEDERKNPSWKRRMHRFYKSVKPEEVVQLHDAFYLAELSYVDTIDEIKGGLNGTEWELMYAQMEAHPGEPGHYLALKKKQNRRSGELECLLSVRGTKELGDLLSDAFLDADNFRGGKAHAGVKLAGTYLVKKHIGLLKELLQLTDKKRIKLLLVGHSLGAGAASIAAMEFNDYDFIDATAIGFGTPSLLNKELAATTQKYIVSVVSDADVVPRMSGATVQNAILDIMSYDWTDRAVRDVQQLIAVVRANTPVPISEETEKKIVDFVKKSLPAAQMIPPERQQQLLIPPGRCIHFYRDGASVSARHTPCDYFDTVEITRTMVDDHLTPSGYHRMMLHFMRDSTNDMHFKFAHDTLF